MSIERVKDFFRAEGIEEQILEFPVSSATVPLAAKALGCEEGRIAKTLSFHGPEGVVLLVTAGDQKIDNAKYKAYFGLKAKMLSPEEVEPLTGHGIGGVCPFALKEGVRVYLDRSLQRFETVYPACGSENSAIALTIPALERYSRATAWVDVCKAK